MPLPVSFVPHQASENKKIKIIILQKSFPWYLWYFVTNRYVKYQDWIPSFFAVCFEPRLDTIFNWVLGSESGIRPDPCQHSPLKAVLRIRDDPEFFPSRIPDPNLFYSGSPIRIKEFNYLNPKNCLLSSRKYDPGCSSRIRIFTHPDPGSRGQEATDPGSWSATLLKRALWRAGGFSRSSRFLFRGSSIQIISYL